MARIGIYCGSFSPVHKGHIRIAKQCLKQKLVDKVMIIATGSYWNKNDLLPLKDRLNMLELVKDKGIIIDKKHNEYPYTYQIFRELKKERPGDTFSLILGADNLINFSDWKEYKELLEYDFIIVNRQDIDARKYLAELNKTNYHILELEQMDISSSYIRDHLDDYQLIKDMIDERVYEYLKERKDS